MVDDPIFPAGIHQLDEAEIGNHFLSSFPASISRPKLVTGLQDFIDKLKTVGIPFEVWLDGSFVTKKEEPNDIDLVVFASASLVNSLDAPKQSILKALFSDQLSTKAKYGCDVYFIPAEDTKNRSYWRGWFGFDRDENPKGIASVTVNP